MASTHNVLVRAIRHAKANDHVGRNVASLVKPPRANRAPGPGDDRGRGGGHSRQPDASTSASSSGPAGRQSVTVSTSVPVFTVLIFAAIRDGNPAAVWCGPLLFRGHVAGCRVLVKPCPESLWSAASVA